MGEGVNNRVKFLVGTIPVLLTILKLMVKEEKRVPSIIILLLHHASIGHIRGVGREANWPSGVKRAEEHVITNCLEEGLECLLLGATFGPGPGDVFLEEIIKAGNGVGIMRDKFIIESEHSKDMAKVVNASGLPEVTKGLYFVSSHTDALTADNVEAQEIDLFSEPFAFVRFEAEFIFPESSEDLSDLLLVRL